MFKKIVPVDLKIPGLLLLSAFALSACSNNESSEPVKPVTGTENNNNTGANSVATTGTDSVTDGATGAGAETDSGTSANTDLIEGTETDSGATTGAVPGVDAGTTDSGVEV